MPRNANHFRLGIALLSMFALVGVSLRDIGVGGYGVLLRMKLPDVPQNGPSNDRYYR